MNRDYYAGMTEGRIKERDRIVALLKQHRIDTNWTRTHFEYYRAIFEITQLIKGQLDCAGHTEGKLGADCTCKMYNREGEKGIANGRCNELG